MKDQCTGTMYNGPDKRFTRCNICGVVDYEANEGDTCRAQSRCTSIHPRNACRCARYAGHRGEHESLTGRENW